MKKPTISGFIGIFSINGNENRPERTGYVSVAAGGSRSLPEVNYQKFPELVPKNLLNL